MNEAKGVIIAAIIAAIATIIATVITVYQPLKQDQAELQRQIVALRTENAELHAEIDRLNAELEKVGVVTPTPIPTSTKNDPATPDNSSNVTLSGEPDVWLSDLDYFDKSREFYIRARVETDNWGNDHPHSLQARKTPAMPYRITGNLYVAMKTNPAKRNGNVIIKDQLKACSIKAIL